MTAQDPSHVLDHVGLAVADLAAARAFYAAALESLGFGVVMEFPGVIALGLPQQPELWMHQGTPKRPDPSGVPRHRPRAGRCVPRGGARRRRDRQRPPGLRPQYHPGYYAAYVKDADGNNVEAVHHGVSG